MTKLLQFAILLCLLSSSCIDVPIFLTMNKDIKVDDKDVKQYKDILLSHFETVKVAPPSADQKLRDACTNGYKQWLQVRFNEGLLPAHIVFSAEYMGARPERNQCLEVDIPKIYKEALVIANDNKFIRNSRFSFESFRQDMEKYECVDAFLDPKKQKVRINRLEMNIKRNTLTTEFPPLTIYTSDKPLSEKDLGQSNELIADKTLTLLATTDMVPPGFAGKKSFIFNKNTQEARNAADNLISLTGIMMVAPEEISTNPPTKMIKNNKFFTLPQGQFEAQLIVQIDISVNLADGKCVLKEFYRQIEEAKNK